MKLTPNVTNIVDLARVAGEAGADAITATNTLSGLAGIDLESFSPLPAVAGVGVFGGYSGPGLKPVSLRCAAGIAQATACRSSAAVGSRHRRVGGVFLLLLSFFFFFFYEAYEA